MATVTGLYNDTMMLAEKHIVKSDNTLESLCFKSARLYNFITYHYRQAIFGNQEYFTENEISTLCASFDQEDYRNLPAQTSQQVIKQVFQNFDSWKKATKEYKKNPTKFTNKPKLPGFKKGKNLNLIIFTNQQIVLRNGFLFFPKKLNLKPIKTKVKKIKQVRIIPKVLGFVIDVLYESQITPKNLDKKRVLSIDMGLKNLCTTSNNIGKAPFIVNGTIMKSFNQWFNKNKSSLQKRSDLITSKKIKNLLFYRGNWMNDKIHKVSRYIVDYCKDNNIGTIVIGKNDNWKTDINIGTKNNQHFVSIPHACLIDKIKYKSELVGISVIIVNESYTSKCDSLMLEPISKQEKYLGKRIKRGLFKSGIGKIINADVNGAINILRKSNVIGEDFVKDLINSGLVYNPYIINII